MKIRVLHVIDHLGYGGAPFVVKGIVERMPPDKVESLVCALRPNPKPLPIQAEVITLKGSKYSPAAIRFIANLCKTRRIDIVHAHLQKAVLSSLFATYLGVGRLILHEHGPIFRGGTGCVYRWLLRLLGPRADMIVANSEAAKSAMEKTLRRSALVCEKWHGHPAREASRHRHPADDSWAGSPCHEEPTSHTSSEVPIIVVPNFIDVAQFDPDRHDRDRIRESLGFGRDQFVVGFVGRLDRAKGPDVLVEAAALLPNQGDSWRFLIVGAGPQRERLERRIRKLDLDGIVVLAGLHENPAAVMRAFDAGLVPSRREAFGIAALEMMRMRVPVIVSPVGGLPELVRDGQTGIVLPELSPQAIAQSIRRLKEDSPLRDKLSRNAFEHASSFDGREQVQQIVGIYERLISTQGRANGT